MTPIRKAIKYFFIALISLIALLVIAVVLSMVLPSNEKKEKTITKTELAHNAMRQMASYYHKNTYYPKNLQELPLYKTEEFVSHLNKHSFQYFSYGENKSKFIFSWKGGAMDWTGYSCTNDKSELSKKQNGVVRTYTMTGGIVCTVTDLH